MRNRPHFVEMTYKLLLLLLLLTQSALAAPREGCDAYISIVTGQQARPILNTKDTAVNIGLIEKVRAIPGGKVELLRMEERQKEIINIIRNDFRPDIPIDSNSVKLVQIQPSSGGGADGPSITAISAEEFKNLENQFLEYLPILNRMSELLQDSKRLYTLSQRFWLETLIERSTSNEDTRIAFENVLARYERRAGFPAAVDLEDKPYSSVEWWAMLREGKPFNDLVFANNDGSRRYHFVLTHRLQWVLNIMQMEADPSYFGLTRAQSDNVFPRLFSFIGDERLRGRLTWKDGLPGDSVWKHLFDAFSPNGRSPEWLSKFFNHCVSGIWY